MPIIHQLEHFRPSGGNNLGVGSDIMTLRGKELKEYRKVLKFLFNVSGC